MSIEQRSLPTSSLEIRKSADGKRTLTGIAAPFNSLSEDLGGFRERILPGAFAATLRSNPDVRLSADHDLSVSKILARTVAGTMQLRESSNAGLVLSATLPDTSFASDVAESISRGDVNGLSISFNAEDESWDNTSDGVVRTLRAVSLGPEISLVATPAYKAASVSLRSCPEAIRSMLTTGIENDADFLKDAALYLLLAKRKQF